MPCSRGWPTVLLEAGGELRQGHGGPRLHDATYRPYRPLHDGTHGSGVNPNLRIRDQLRYPRGAELKHVLTVLHNIPGPSLGLVADVSKAHRLYKHRPPGLGVDGVPARRPRHRIRQHRGHLRDGGARLTGGDACLPYWQGVRWVWWERRSCGNFCLRMTLIG